MIGYDDFQGRVNLAASYISQGRDVSCSRTFSGCFEMHDGDAVVTALIRRARKRPEGNLAKNLWRYIARESSERAAAENEHRTDLAAWAKEMRDEAEREFTAWQTYEADRQKRPTFSDGTPRKRWHELSQVAKSAWFQPTESTTYPSELTEAGEQLCVPGCEPNANPATQQLKLF